MLSCFRRQNEFVERNYMTGFFGGEISTLFKYETETGRNSCFLRCQRSQRRDQLLRQTFLKASYMNCPPLYIYILAVPRKGFGSAECVQRNELIMSQLADSNTFRGTASMCVRSNSINNSFKSTRSLWCNYYQP